ADASSKGGTRQKFETRQSLLRNLPMKSNITPPAQPHWRTRFAHRQEFRSRIGEQHRRRTRIGDCGDRCPLYPTLLKPKSPRNQRSRQNLFDRFLTPLQEAGRAGGADLVSRKLRPESLIPNTESRALAP